MCIVAWNDSGYSYQNISSSHKRVFWFPRFYIYSRKYFFLSNIHMSWLDLLVASNPNVGLFMFSWFLVTFPSIVIWILTKVGKVFRDVAMCLSMLPSEHKRLSPGLNAWGFWVWEPLSWWVVGEFLSMVIWPEFSLLFYHIHLSGILYHVQDFHLLTTPDSAKWSAWFAPCLWQNN